MILHGDSIRELYKIEQNSIDLIYLDPPFFTQKIQKLKTKDNTKEYSFEDTWDNILEYKNYIQKRLKKCRDTFKIFLIQELLRIFDELRSIIFGFAKFKNCS